MKKWIIDPDHSVAGFAVRHMMLVNVRGQFNKISGVINFDPSDIPRSTVEAIIDATGIYTGISKRDAHIRTADFFDVEKYPQIKFKSTKVEDLGAGRLKIDGDLTIRGISRPVSFDAQYLGPVKSPFDEGITVGFTASAKIDRRDFEVLWNETWEGGGIMASWDVGITLDIEADLAA